jgi:predicted permease
MKPHPLANLDADIRDHIDRETQDNIDRGIAPDEARRQALVKFGNAAAIKEDTRAVWVSRWIDEGLQDLRYAVRALRRNPAFSVVVVLTLALAIGMNTAVFSVFNAVVLRPVAYPSPERLVWVSTVGTEGEAGIVTGPDFIDWHDQAASFDRMVAYSHADYTLADARGAMRVRGASVTDGFWDMSGARPVDGRLPRVEERGNVVLLSHDFALRRFGGGPDVIGRTITLDGRQVTVVGVLAHDFRFDFPASAWPGLRPGDVEVYRPFVVSSARKGQIQLLNVVGRLNRGVTLERAQAEIETIRTRTAQMYPHPDSDRRTLRIVPLQDQLIGASGYALWILLAAVAFVLLIACANAANLLLARASARRHEIAIRVSVGAGRARILKQLLMESGLLAGLGSAAGLLLASVCVAAIQQINPYAVPRLAEVTLDGRVLGVVLGIAVLTAFVFGLVPALALWKVDHNNALKDRGVGRIRWLLVGAEIALAMVLLTGAGLMVKSVWQLNAYPAGFKPDEILTAQVELAGREYFELRRQTGFVEALLRGVQAEPGVEAATISTHGHSLTNALHIEGDSAPTPEGAAGKPPIMINSTTAAFARVMGLHVERGRWFNDDTLEMVVNETLARREFQDNEPLGRRIQLWPAGPLFTIVGVVRDLRYSQLDVAAEPEMYVPYSRTDGIFAFTLLVRSTGDPLAAVPALRQLVSNIDKTQVADDVMTLEQALEDSIAPRRLNLFVLGTFAVTALMLALVGIYGVMAYLVTQGTHEIGVRMALGARPEDVMRLVVRQGMTVALAGVTAGLIGAFGLTRAMAGLLYDVRPTDPQTFAIVTLALVASAFVACCVPAIRAAMIDPVTALRYE